MDIACRICILLGIQLQYISIQLDLPLQCKANIDSVSSDGVFIDLLAPPKVGDGGTGGLADVRNKNPDGDCVENDPPLVGLSVEGFGKKRPKCKPKFPPIIDRKRLKNITVEVSKSAVIKVFFIANPPPNVTFSRKDKTINDGQRNAITITESNATLVISSVSRDTDMGKYNITARNSVGNDSVTVMVTVVGRSSPPIDFSIEKYGPTYASLKWSPPLDNGGSDIMYYRIEKQDMTLQNSSDTSGNGRESWVMSEITKKLNKTLINLTPGHAYHFRVSAVNKYGTSEYVQTKEPIVVCGPPSPPKNLTVTRIGKDNVTLNWNPPKYDNDAKVTDYVIQYAKESNGTNSTWEKIVSDFDNKQLKAVVTGLESGQRYQFRVSAVNSHGQSDASKPTPFVTILSVPPPPENPNIKKITVKDVTLEWSKPKSNDTNNNTLPITKYIVETKQSPNGQWTPVKEVPANQTDATIANLTSEASYQLQVKAVNDVGESKPSKESHIFTVPTNKTAPIIDMSNLKDAEVFEGKSFKTNTLVNGDPRPQVYWKLNGKNITFNENIISETKGKAISLEIKKAKPSDAGIYTIIAVNSKGIDTEKFTLRVLTLPLSPEKPIIKNITHDKTIVAWKMPHSNKTNALPVKKFIVQAKHLPDGQWIPVKEVPANQTDATFTNLTSGESYELRVKAVNDVGESKPSDASDAFKIPASGNRSVIDLSNIKDITTTEGQTIKLEIPVHGDPPPEVSFEHNGERISSDNRIKVDKSGEISSLEIKTVINDTGKYTIIAENKFGTDTVNFSITVLSVPSPPEGPLIANLSPNNSVELNWKPPKDGPKPDGHSVEEQMDNGEWKQIMNTTETHANVKHPQNGRDSKFRVSAFNNAGKSAPLEAQIVGSIPVPNAILGPPGKPRILRIGNDHVDLQWDPPKQLNGHVLKGYELQLELVNDETNGNMTRKKRQINDNRLILQTANNSVRVNHLISQKKYRFRVRAVSVTGVQSLFSQSTDAIIGRKVFSSIIARPDCPGKPYFKNISNNHLICWKTLNSVNQKYIKEYIIEMKENDDHWTRVETLTIDKDTCSNDEHCIVFNNMTSHKSYEFRVKRVNVAGVIPMQSLNRRGP